MRQLLSLLPLVLAQLSCTVSAKDPNADAGASNSCGSNADCRGGERCREGLCQVLNGELESLLVVAQPAANSGIPHFSFVTSVNDIPAESSGRRLELPGAVSVTGVFELPEKLGCTPSFISDDADSPIVPSVDRTLPATLTLSLRQRLLGLPQERFYVNTNLETLLKGGYSFEVQVPGGEYDAYVVPYKRQEPGCIIPPKLFRNLSAGNSSFKLSAGVSNLTLNLRWPVGVATLAGWSVDIIEPEGGNPISNEIILGDPQGPEPGADTVQYVVPLVYSQVFDLKTETFLDSADDLVRLRPPEGSSLPTIFLHRSALGVLQKDGKQALSFTDFTHVPVPVKVRGRMLDKETGAPVSGFVTLVSTGIQDIDPGVFGSFETTVDVGEDGVIDVTLPPGSYRVLAVPPLMNFPSGAKTLSAVQTNWEIAAGQAEQFGKVVELPTLVLRGQTQVRGAQVLATPSPQRVSPFEEAFGRSPFAPRATSGLVDDSGRFALFADPGRFDLAVQAPEALGFAWTVRPGVEVGEADQELGRVLLTSPAVLSGDASVVGADGSETPLASATIRAYAYLDKQHAYTRDAASAESVVQVAETRADESGAFRLLLPPRLEPPKLGSVK
jgi:hypothetical protein